jgi:universal stress protein E
MQRFTNILACVSLDGESHPALERAARLAHANHAALTVAAVQEGLPGWASAILPEKAQHWEEIVSRQAENRLEELCAPLREQGVPISTKLMKGQPFVQLLREVLGGGHDLLVKDLVLEDTLDASSIGSVDMHLLRKCPCPVWLVKPDSAKRFARILAAVDPLPGEEEPADSVNVQVLELATSLALQEQCKLFVVRVYETIAQSFAAAGLENGESTGYLEHIQTVRIKNDEEFIGRFAGSPGQFDVRFVFGQPGMMIADVARKEDVDLIVMGTVAYAGTPGVLMGRTAENVLRQVGCSVLGVKPKGFMSPQ